MAAGSQNLIKHMQGTANRPDAYKEEKGVPVVSPGVPATAEQIEACEKHIDEFDQREYMAKHIMLTTVSPHLASVIRGKTAHHMWVAIKQDATDKSDMAKTQAQMIYGVTTHLGVFDNTSMP